MKHQVEIKLPKLFGKKKDEVIEENKESEDLKIDLEKDLNKFVIPGVTLASGLLVGYAVGHSRGIKKAIQSQNIFVIK